MTDADTNTNTVPPDPDRFIQAWSASLAQVLGQISGSPLPCVVHTEGPAELPPAGEGDLWAMCTCTGGLRGEMSLRIPPASVLLLAQIFMSEPPSASAELTPDHREAAVELLRQVAGLVTTGIKPIVGEVQLRLESSPGAPSWPASTTLCLCAGEAPSGAAWLEVQLSAALAAALRSERTEAAKPASAAAPPAIPPASSNPRDNKTKLDLLMDVELALTLRFGTRRLLLREILDLNPGSVVDLDRQVQEPVDVLLDGRLVARGEVVVIDGNYGVRVTEVPSAGA